MRLETLYTVLREEQTITILDYDSYEELARYDGRDSIPMKFNKYKVVEIFAGADYDLRVYVTKGR